MLLSTQTDRLAELYGDEKAIRMIAEAGFDAYDFSFFKMLSGKDYEMDGPDFRDYAKKLRALADSCGISCNQAHAPFSTPAGDDPELFAAILRSMEAAAILGAENIVVHPLHHIPYRTNAAALKEMNVAFYRRLVPYCEQFGIHVACENMFQRNKASGRLVPSVCARPEEFCEYLDEIGSPWIIGCLDVGHTALTDQDLSYYVHTMGSKRLRALHVHDNALQVDDHTLPFTEKLDFSVLTDALAEIGYEGDFTFEADNFLRKFPAGLEKPALDLMYAVGRYLVGQIESHTA